MNPERPGRGLGDLSRTAGLDEAGGARHLTGAHAALPKRGPHLRAALAAACTGEVWFDVGESDVIGPAVSVGFDVMAAVVIAAVDQHIANAGLRAFRRR